VLLTKPFGPEELVGALEAIDGAGAPRLSLCTYCGAERPPRTLRVFTQKKSVDHWAALRPVLEAPEVGFEAHRPSENLQLRLTATIPVHVTEVRGWVRTGLKQVGRR
jgi:hypothetical protein